MTKIGLISDTHNFLDEAVFRHFDKCDEIWHAGDFGNLEIAERLGAFKPIREFMAISMESISGEYSREAPLPVRGRIGLHETYRRLSSPL